jgi:L-lysine 2,3-aminomutase
LKQVTELSEEQKDELRGVTDKFVFRSNDYYQQLINWDDPNDPIKQLIMPNIREMDDWGKLDASGEHAYTKCPRFGAQISVNRVASLQRRVRGILPLLFQEAAVHERQ